MEGSRLDRLAPLSGILALVCVGAAAAMIGVYDYLPTGEKLVEVFSRSPNTLVVSGLLGNLSAFFMFVFASFTAVRLRQGSTPAGWLVKLAYGGGIATALVIGVGFTSLIATGSRAGSPGGIGPIEAVTLYDFYGNLLGDLFGVTMACFMLAAAVIWLRAGVLPSWFNWAAIVVGILLVTPVAYILEPVALVWILVVSVRMYARPASPA
jgi:hypothetical protein